MRQVCNKFKSEWTDMTEKIQSISVSLMKISIRYLQLKKFVESDIP